MRVLGKFVQAILWQGNRRWIVTSPSALVAVTSLINNYLIPLPSNIAVAFIWQPKWWTWGLSILFGIVVVSYLAWREQFLTARELAGRPDLTLSFTESGEFLLRHSNSHAAVNITGKEIVLDVPPQLSEDVSTTREIDSAGQEKVLTEWRVSFHLIGSMVEHDYGKLTYTIWGLGQLAHADLLSYLSILAKYENKDIPFTLAFSNLGAPKRTWHSHYNLKYEPLTQSIVPVHRYIGEIDKCGLCSHCRALLREQRPTLRQRVLSLVDQLLLESTKHAD